METRLSQRMSEDRTKLPGPPRETQDEKIVHAFYDIIDITRDQRALLENLHRLVSHLETYLISDAEKWAELRELRKTKRLWAKRDEQERRKRLRKPRR